MCLCLKLSLHLDQDSTKVRRNCFIKCFSIGYPQTPLCTPEQVFLCLPYLGQSDIDTRHYSEKYQCVSQCECGIWGTDIFSFHRFLLC